MAGELGHEHPVQLVGQADVLAVVVDVGLTDDAVAFDLRLAPHQAELSRGARKAQRPIGEGEGQRVTVNEPARIGVPRVEIDRVDPSR